MIKITYKKYHYSLIENKIIYKDSEILRTDCIKNGIENILDYYIYNDGQHVIKIRMITNIEFINTPKGERYAYIPF